MSGSNTLKLQVILGAIDKATGPLKQVMAGSSGLSRALKETATRLKDLGAEQKHLVRFRQTASDVDAASRALDTARQKTRDLQAAIIAAERPSKNLTEEYKASRRALQGLERASERAKQSHEESRRAVERLGVPVGRLAERERHLAGEISRANTALAQQGARLKQLNAARREFDKTMQMRGAIGGAGLGMVGAGTAMGLPIIAAIKQAASFEDAMTGVAKQVDGMRDGNGRLTRSYYEMASAIKSLSGDARIGLATNDIAALIEAGARMGIQGKADLLEYARTAGIAATAFDAAAGEIGENIAKIANLYKIPIANIGELGDTINWLDDNAQSKGADIINVLQRIAGITQTVGMSFKDSAALGSTFLSLGASAEIAATASNAVIRELAIAASQPKKFQAALASIGLSPNAVQMGMVKDASGTIMKVLSAIKALPQEQQLTAATGLFGKEYGDDVAKLAQGMDEYRRQLALVNDEQARGSMLREADARASNISARWQITMNRLFNASSAAGLTLKGTLLGIMDATGGVLERLDGWMQANPGITKAIMTTGAALAAIVTALGALALALAAVIGPLAMIKMGFALITPVIGAISLPVLGVIAAIAAVGVAGWALYDNWDRIKSAFTQLWEGIKAIFSGGIDYVTGKLKSIASWLGLGAAGTAPTGIKRVAAGATINRPLRPPAPAGNTTITAPITIHAAPGQSEAAIAQEVGRQLAARERQAGVKARGRIGDLE